MIKYTDIGADKEVIAICNAEDVYVTFKAK